MCHLADALPRLREQAYPLVQISRSGLYLFRKGLPREEADHQVGRKLRLARERQGHSLKDMERLVTIHAHHLAALEREDFEALPDSSWARGFLVSYASQLGFEGEALAEDVFPRQRRPRPVRYIERHWRGLAALLGTVVAAVMIVFASTIIAPYNVVTGKITDALDRILPGQFLENGPQRIVVLGFVGGETTGDDSVMVVRIADDGFGLLSIPGNTLVEIPGQREGKISDASTRGGADLTRRATARLIGFEVPHYLIVRPNGIREIVNAMDGVRIDVPKSVSGQAWGGGPTLTLRQGPQVLSGEEALVYLEGSDLRRDVERAGRQQAFLSTMFRQALGPANLLSDPFTLNTMREHTESNISLAEAVQLAGRLKASRDSGADLETATVPGREGAAPPSLDGTHDGYWLPDYRKLKVVLEETVG